MKTSNLQQVPYFDNRSFFKDSCPVYIQLSTEFPKYVGVMHRHQFVEVVYILSGQAVHTVGDREYTVKTGCGCPVASISKELFHWTDTYTIDIHDPADALCALMLVLAIDAEKCSRN